MRRTKTLDKRDRTLFVVFAFAALRVLSCRRRRAEKFERIQESASRPVHLTARGKCPARARVEAGVRARALDGWIGRGLRPVHRLTTAAAAALTTATSALSSERRRQKAWAGSQSRLSVTPLNRQDPSLLNFLTHLVIVSTIFSAQPPATRVPFPPSWASNLVAPDRPANDE